MLVAFTVRGHWALVGTACGLEKAGSFLPDYLILYKTVKKAMRSEL